jgi:hypothetical protein
MIKKNKEIYKIDININIIMKNMINIIIVILIMIIFI